MIEIEFSLFTNKVGSACSVVIPFDAEEWSELNDAERDQYVKDVFWEDALSRLGGWDWQVVA